MTLGSGERLFEGVGSLSLEPVSITGNGLVTHLRYASSAALVIGGRATRP
jgi:hypothetical protein